MFEIEASGLILMRSIYSELNNFPAVRHFYACT